MEVATTEVGTVCAKTVSLTDKPYGPSQEEPERTRRIEHCQQMGTSVCVYAHNWWIPERCLDLSMQRSSVSVYF